MAKTTPDPPHNDDDIVVRPFADWLREQAKGNSHEDLSQALNALVNAVVETGKKGTLTYQIVVAPIKKAEAHVLSITDAVVLKAPGHDRPVSVFYSNEGNLQRKDPLAPELPGMQALEGGRADTPDSKEKRA